MQRAFSTEELLDMYEVQEFLNDLIDEGWHIDQFQYSVNEQTGGLQVVVVASKIVYDSILSKEQYLYDAKATY